MNPPASRHATPASQPGGRQPDQPADGKLPAKKAAGGRPPKYSGPSRPITVTLPEKTLEALERIHHDRGQAIVKLAEDALVGAPGGIPMVEIVEMAANTGLLVVGPSKALRRIPFLHLVEVAPNRFLLALDSGKDFTNLEIAIQDVLDEVPEEEAWEREMIRQLLEKVRHLRKAARVSMAEILFVRLREKSKATLQTYASTVVWLLASAA